MFSYNDLLSVASSNGNLFTGTGDGTQGTANNWIYVASQLYGGDTPSGHFLFGWTESQLESQMMTASQFWNNWQAASGVIGQAKTQNDTVSQYPPVTTIVASVPTSSPDVAQKVSMPTTGSIDNVGTTVTSEQTNTTNSTLDAITRQIQSTVSSGSLTDILSQTIFGLPVWVIGVVVVGVVYSIESGSKRHGRFE